MSIENKDAAIDTTLEQEQPAAQPKEQETPASDFMSDPEVQAYIAKQVQEGIQKALQGKAPKANTADMTAAERVAFQQMSYKERLKLFNSDPHTYNKLVKGNV